MNAERLLIVKYRFRYMANPRKNIIGPIVRRLRNAQALSQEGLAAKCQLIGWDITREGIAKIEGQVRHVDDIEVVHLCRALRVKSDLLLNLTQRKNFTIDRGAARS